MAGSDRSVRGFLRELKRRHVYQIGVAYLLVSFAVWEGAGFAFPRLGLEDWTLTLVLVLTLGGFPIALVLAWAYEVAPDAGPGVAPQGVATELAKPGPTSFPKNRIAILPLSSISPESGDEYFADGMTEELISVISRIRGLDVIARTSVMQYKNEDKGILEIARELGVGTVLEGSVRKAGEDLRITVQLIDAASEGHLWSEDYDRELAEIFDIQRDIARRVADALEVRLLESDEERIEETPTANLQAYDFYLLGRFHLNRRTDESLRRAIEYFQRAIAADPSFAPAFAGLSETFTFAGLGYSADPPDDALAKAVEAAQRAIEFDETLAQGHLALALASIHLLDSQTANRAVERALELNPSFAETHQIHAWCLCAMRRFTEAISAQDRALALDPRSVTIMTESGWPYSYQGQHETALERYRAAIEMDPTFALAHFNVGWALQRMGSLQEAVEAYEKSLSLSGGMPLMRAFLATTYVELGREDEARTILSDLEKMFHGGGPPVAMVVALVHEALGQSALAMDWLETAFQRREPTMAWVGLTPEFLPFVTLQGDPRFHNLMRQLGRSSRAEVG